MAHSSWGPGWPNCQPGRINKTFAVTSKQGRIVFPGGIRTELTELVDRLVKETVNRGYRFGIPGNSSYGCWGYNCRAISGTNKPSNHSWGLAVDINAPTNPYKAPLTTDMPGWMPDLWNAYGFRWGGDYSSTKKDAMHYEFMGSAQDAANHTNKARANRLGEVIDPMPTAAEVAKAVWATQVPHMNPVATGAATRPASELLGYTNRNSSVASCLLDSDKHFPNGTPQRIDALEAHLDVIDQKLAELKALITANQ